MPSFSMVEVDDLFYFYGVLGRYLLLICNERPEGSIYTEVKIYGCC